MLLIPWWSARSAARGRAASAAPGPHPLQLLVAAGAPLALCGLGLLAYNYLRFQNPLEFGQHYQLAADRQDSARHFSLAYLAFNFRAYFIAPASWSRHFPFVGPMTAPPLPPGHAVPEDPFGILTNIPFAALALAAPLAWRDRPEEERRSLRGFAAAAAILFAGAALVLGLFYGSCSRYEAEFLPPLILLAAVGALGLERLPAARRRAARAGWLLLLGFSIAFNLLQGVQRRSIERYTLGNTLTGLGRLPEAIAQYEAALRAQPDFGEAHNNLGNAFFRLGRLSQAIAQYEAALRLQPDTAALHYNLGILLAQTGRLAEAAAHDRAAIRLRPDFAAAHLNLGAVLSRLGQPSEAAAEFRTANALATPASEKVR
jgi:tetratricopeptide (TPR) repeat protein